MNFLDQSQISFEQFDLLELFIRLGLAFLLSSVAGIFYLKSRRLNLKFDQIVFGGIALSLIVTMILLVLSANVFYALGLFAALSIIRFRTPVKEVYDTVHLFLAIAIGIACGAGALKIAIFSTLFILTVQFLFCQFLQKSERFYVIKIIAEGSGEAFKEIEKILSEKTKRSEIVQTHRIKDKETEYLHHIEPREAIKIQEIVMELSKIISVIEVFIFPARTSLDS